MTNSTANEIAMFLETKAKTVKTDNNKKNALNAAKLARQDNVVKFIKLSKMTSACTSDLYFTMKLLKTINVITSEHTNNANNDKNTRVAIATAMLNEKSETFESILLKMTISNRLDKEYLTSDLKKKMIRRVDLISAERQESMQIRLFTTLNAATLVSSTKIKMLKTSYAYKTIAKFYKREQDAQA